MLKYSGMLYYVGAVGELGAYKKLSVTMPTELLTQLDEWATSLGMSRSEAIRHAIRVATQVKGRR